MTHQSDQTILDWLDKRAADVLFMREADGMEVAVSYVAQQSGVRTEARAGTLRAAVSAAIEVEALHLAGDTA